MAAGIIAAVVVALAFGALAWYYRGKAVEVETRLTDAVKLKTAESEAHEDHAQALVAARDKRQKERQAADEKAASRIGPNDGPAATDLLRRAFD